MKGYDTAEYAATRLVDTIIRKGGVPVLVIACNKGVGGSIIITYNSLLEKSPDKYEKAPITEFDINPVPLGYINHKGIASYIMRAPMRRDWRQGARTANLTDIEGFQPKGVPYSVIANTIMGKYPTIPNSIEAVQSGKSSMAFHRDFSVTAGMNVFYKGLLSVGVINHQNGQIKLNHGKDWLIESIEEIGAAA